MTFGNIKNSICMKLDFIKYRFLSMRQIRKHIDGNASLTSKQRLCLFSHFDKHNKIDPYVINYLKTLFSLNCAIIFVSTCHALSADDIRHIRPYVSKIIIRKNFGLDFASWKTALNYVKDIERYSQILLCNDSVYGPLFDLNEIFNTMTSKNLDMWGITDSREKTYHLQSYFLVFNNRPRVFSFFKEFWNDYQFINNKHYIIDNYEIGISQKAIKKNLMIKGFCHCDETVSQWKNANSLKMSIEVINPMHHCWKYNIEKFKCPFIKIELLRDNPFKIEALSSWEEVLNSNTSYDKNLILKHLKRVANLDTMGSY